MVTKDKASPAQIHKGRRKDLFYAHGILTLALGWRQVGFSETTRLFQKDRIVVEITHRITEDYGNLIRRVRVHEWDLNFSLTKGAHQSNERSDWHESFTASWPQIVAEALALPRSRCETTP